MDQAEYIPCDAVVDACARLSLPSCAAGVDEDDDEEPAHATTGEQVRDGQETSQDQSGGDKSGAVGDARPAVGVAGPGELATGETATPPASERVGGADVQRKLLTLFDADNSLDVAGSVVTAETTQRNAYVGGLGICITACPCQHMRSCV